MAVNVANTRSIYGSTLTYIGVKGTAYFDNGTGKFSGHGGFSKLSKQNDIFHITDVRRTGTSNTSYKAIQKYELSSTELGSKIFRYETVTLRIPSPGSMR